MWSLDHNDHYSHLCSKLWKRGEFSPSCSMIHPLSYNILSFHCPNYKQMGKWQVLFYGVVKRPVSSEFKFSLLKKPWPVPGLGICNKQSYFSCPVTVSMPWGCVPGTHEKIIPCECSPAGCGCPCLHCIAVTLQMKNRQLRVDRKSVV